MELTKADIFRKMQEQLAIDFNCKPEDFTASKNILVKTAALPGRRMFSNEEFFLQMATFGDNLVVSAAEEIHPWLEGWIQTKKGIWLFEQNNMLALERELRKHGKILTLTHHMFLPKPEIIPVKPEFSVKWLEQPELAPFYGLEELPNVLCSEFKTERPDMLGVIALDGDKMMGMAGASADSKLFWQIGIDVLPEYRGRGVGTALVSLLRNEIFNRGAIPYYGTSLSNIYSWNIAINSGFIPAWVEIESTNK